MKEINLSPHTEKGDKLTKELKSLISKLAPNLEVEHSKFKIRKSEFPFRISDNKFDLHLGSSKLFEKDVRRKKIYCFTGGSLIIEYEINGDSPLIIHGNDEEGYNIFTF